MIQPQSLFVTGTDTGIGKTHVARQWIAYWRNQGRLIVPMKPISAGCRITSEGLHNEDALQLIAAADQDLPYQRVNRYALEPPIAPHIAAAEAGLEIQLAPLVEDFHWLQNQGEAVCVEGAGGWRVPLSESLTTADLVRALDIPVLLVVGLRLGCISHALLTEEAILADGCNLLGWVANRCDPEMQRPQENIQCLIQRMRSPLLWVQESDPITDG